eukprot:GDKJ01047392.1.p1 GENE.GDKJ01047392.1~~GDKJ01047392.1.p1  ORF type:complete len:711 (+),score=197.18 GDKJ01047392.1:226-2133(+)
MERLRFLRSKNEASVPGDLRLRISTDPTNHTLTFWDAGVGMNKEELIKNLGTIARSGSRAFLEEHEDSKSSSTANTIIGQFGVGFYSGFVVADKMEVFTRSALNSSDKKAYRWVSNGTGEFEVEELSSDDSRAPEYGTKIVLHLKDSLKDKFCDSENIVKIAKKFSSFVNFPIDVDGAEISRSSQPWTSSSCTEEEHNEFFKSISGSSQPPRFHLTYQTEVPLSISSVFYIPKDVPKQNLFQPTADANVSLHSRKVLVNQHANAVIPHWLRFIHGVIDCEDMPMNIARESMQDTALLSKLSKSITNRLVRWLNDEAKKDPKKYEEFFADYHVLIKSGILEGEMIESPVERERKMNLLRYESSYEKKDGEKSDEQHNLKYVSLDEYVKRMKEGQEVIFYLTAASKSQAESHPLVTHLKQLGVEVLFMLHEVDEFLSTRLGEYKGKLFMNLGDREANEEIEKIEKAVGWKSESDQDGGPKIIELFEKWGDLNAMVSLNTRLGNDAVVAVGGLSKTMKMVNKQSLMAMLEQGGHKIDEKMISETLNQYQLQVNPNHEIIREIFSILTSDAIKDEKDENSQAGYSVSEEVAGALVRQLVNAAKLRAGYVEEPSELVTDMVGTVVSVLKGRKNINKNDTL